MIGVFALVNREPVKPRCGRQHTRTDLASQVKTRARRPPRRRRGSFARETEFEIILGERPQVRGTARITAFDSASTGDSFGETKEERSDGRVDGRQSTDRPTRSKPGMRRGARRTIGGP